MPSNFRKGCRFGLVMCCGSISRLCAASLLALRAFARLSSSAFGDLARPPPADAPGDLTDSFILS